MIIDDLFATGGTAEANASGPYEHGSSVTITAIPSTGYDFLSWSGDEVGDSSSISTTISLTEARSVTANFKIKSATSISGIIKFRSV